MGPGVDLSGIGTSIGTAEDGDLEPHDLAVEGSGGGAGQLFQGDDAGMEEDATVFAADAGDTGEIAEGDPFLDVLQMNPRSGAQIFFARSAPGLPQQVEGGFDAEVMQLRAIGFRKSGEILEGPVGRFESLHGRTVEG